MLPLLLPKFFSQQTSESDPFKSDRLRPSEPFSGHSVKTNIIIMAYWALIIWSQAPIVFIPFLTPLPFAHIPSATRLILLYMLGTQQATHSSRASSTLAPLPPSGLCSNVTFSVGLPDHPIYNLTLTFLIFPTCLIFTASSYYHLITVSLTF